MRLLYFFLFLSFLVFPLGQLVDLPLWLWGIEMVRINLYDVNLIIILCLWFLFRGRWQLKVRYLLFFPIALFTILALFSLIVNLGQYTFSQNTLAFLYFFRFVLYTLIYFLIVDLCTYKQKLTSYLIKGLIFQGILLGLFGIFQYYFYPDLRNLMYLGWDPHYLRLFSTFFDPNFTGAVFVVILIILLSQLLLGYIKGKDTIFFTNSSLIIFLIICLLLTYSRSSYLAFLISLLLIIYLSKRIFILFILLIFFFLGMLFIPKIGSEGVNLLRDSTFYFRLDNYKNTLQIFLKNPLFGVGFNNYLAAQRKFLNIALEEKFISHSLSGSDSSLLFALATTGIFGFVSYLTIWFKFLKDIFFMNLYKRGNWIIMASGISVIAMMIHSFFVNSLFYPPIFSMLLILMAISEIKADK